MTDRSDESESVLDRGHRKTRLVKVVLAMLTCRQCSHAGNAHMQAMLTCRQCSHAGGFLRSKSEFWVWPENKASRQRYLFVEIA